MRIIKFTVRNYRSCKNTEFEPNENLTALIGVNGSGKSNLLNALLLIKRIESSRRYIVNEEKEYVNKSYIRADIDLDGSLVSFKGSISFITDDRNIDRVVETNLKWYLESVTGKKSWLNLPIEMVLTDLPYVITRQGKKLSYNDLTNRNWLSHNEMSNILPNKVFPIIKKIARSMAGINYYSASQFSDPSKCPVSLNLEDDFRHIMRSDVITHSKYIYDLYISSKENKSVYNRYVSIIGKYGISIIDKIEFKVVSLPKNIVEVHAGGTMTKKERTNLIIIPVFTIDNQQLSPNQLSEGTFKTLALLFYVLTDQSKILLIEEPEVCIHHGLLDSILEIIKQESRTKQIIISTHSDYVLDQLEPENVILIVKDSVKGTKANKITKALSRNDYRALKYYLKNTGNLGEYWRDGGLDNE